VPGNDLDESCRFVGAALARALLEFNKTALCFLLYCIPMSSRDTSRYRLTSNLRKGRISLFCARYFVTCVAKCTQKSMIESIPAQGIMNVINGMKKGGDIDLLCGTIMPNHVHLLTALTEKLSIGQVVGKFKSLTRSFLSEHGMRWQRNYFEHRLRPDDRASHYARYIFLNPYRAGLVPRKTEWPYWIYYANVDFDFIAFLEDRRYPPEEWLNASLETLGVNPQYIGND